MERSSILGRMVAMAGRLGSIGDLIARHTGYRPAGRFIGGWAPARSKYQPHQGAREMARRVRQGCFFLRGHQRWSV